MPKPSKVNIKTLETSQGRLAYNTELLSPITVASFSAEHWRQQNAVTGSSKGRYTTWFIQPPQDQDEQWVLRHYYRGGLIGKICRDSYIFTGYQQTRAFSELMLLAQLYSEGFAVPKPIAAQVSRHGFYYRADIIITRIEGAVDLVDYLANHFLDESQWRTLGETIAKFHQHGVYHADLNAKNILLAQDKFYLIDFDRGVIKRPNASWQQANLARLQRSFIKEQGKNSQLAFSQQDWSALLGGYQQQMKD